MRGLYALSVKALVCAAFASTLAYAANPSKTTPVIQISILPSPALPNQAVTLVATFDTTSGTPTGFVQFYIDNVSYGAIQPISGNTATIADPVGFLPGTHSVGVTYSGDLNFNTQIYTTNELTFTFNSISVASNPVSPVVSGQPVTLTATIVGGLNVTGTVTFYDNGVAIAGSTVSVSSNQAAFGPYSGFTVSGSPHPITAVYSGDATNFGANNNASPFSLTVTQDGTTTSIPGVTGTPTFGSSVTFSVTVSANSPGSGTPTGSVTFADGATSLGTVTLSSGIASISTSALSTGSHTINASYNGDANFAASSNSKSVTIAQTSPTVSVTSSAAPAVFGQQVTFTATISDGSVAATGTVHFLYGTTDLGTATVSSKQAQVGPFTVPAVGTVSVSAAYSGDTNNAAANGSTSLVVNQAGASVSVPSVSGTQTFGQSLTFSVNLSAVSPGSGTPTGTVTFRDGATVLGSGTIASGAAGIPTASLSAGSHTITATYNGDTDFASGASNSTSVNIAQSAPAVAVTSSPGSPVVNGQAVVLTAGLTGTGNAGGTVDFFDNGTKIFSAVPVVSNQAVSGSYAITGVGTHLITAVYSGDANDGSANNNASPLSLVVNKASTTVSTPAMSGTPNVGATVTFSVTVTPASPGSGVPTGTVTFRDGSTTLGTFTLTGGSASYSTSTLATGSHSITASYSGDGNFLASSSNALSAVIGSRPVTLVTTATPNPPSPGQTVMFTVTIQGGPGGIPPGGTMQFFDGTTPLGAVTVKNGGATFGVVLSIGTHNIQIVYSGDSLYPGATDIYGITVAKYGPSATLSATPQPSVFGQSVTLSGTVTGQTTGIAGPTGQVRFLEGATVLGTATLADGAFSFPLTGLAPGAHTIMVLFGGDGNYGSAWATIVVNVQQASTLTAVSTSGTGPQVTLTGAVKVVAPGAGSPSGTVQFVDATTGQSLASGALSNGVATASAPNAPGHIIVAEYSGDTNFQASNSAPVPQFAVLNSASYQPTDLAADEIVTVFSPSLATGAAQGQTPLPTILGGTSVTLIDSGGTVRLASLFYASQTQLSFLVPPGTAPGPATLQVQTASGAVLGAAVNIGPISPGLYAANAAGGGLAAAQIVRVHSDGSQDIADTTQYDSAQQAWVPVPIDLSVPGDSVYLILYATGIRHKIASVTATVNGQTLPVQYAGAQPAFAGLDQVNVGALPASLKGAGKVDVTITVDGQAANKVQVAFQ